MYDWAWMSPTDSPLGCACRRYPEAVSLKSATTSREERYGGRDYEWGDLVIMACSVVCVVAVTACWWRW